MNHTKRLSMPAAALATVAMLSSQTAAAATRPAAAIPASAAASAQTTTDDSAGVGTLPLLLGLALFVGLAVALLSGGGDGKGSLNPISRG